MQLAALVDVSLVPERPKQLAMVLGIITFVREHGVDAGHQREGGEEQRIHPAKAAG